MTIVPKTTAETVQRSYDAKWSLYKEYPRYAGDELLNTDSYTYIRTHKTVYKNAHFATRKFKANIKLKMLTFLRSMSER
jgi:hypothetical protein